MVPVSLSTCSLLEVEVGSCPEVCMSERAQTSWDPLRGSVHLGCQTRCRSWVVLHPGLSFSEVSHTERMQLPFILGFPKSGSSCLSLFINLLETLF